MLFEGSFPCGYRARLLSVVRMRVAELLICASCSVLVLSLQV
mgnify:CR=1 FL=1